MCLCELIPQNKIDKVMEGLPYDEDPTAVMKGIEHLTAFTPAPVLRLAWLFCYVADDDEDSQTPYAKSHVFVASVEHLLGWLLKWFQRTNTNAIITESLSRLDHDRVGVWLLCFLYSPEWRDAMVWLGKRIGGSVELVEGTGVGEGLSHKRSQKQTWPT